MPDHGLVLKSSYSSVPANSSSLCCLSDGLHYHTMFSMPMPHSFLIMFLHFHFCIFVFLTHHHCYLVWYPWYAISFYFHFLRCILWLLWRIPVVASWYHCLCCLLIIIRVLMVITFIIFLGDCLMLLWSIASLFYFSSVSFLIRDFWHLILGLKFQADHYSSGLRFRNLFWLDLFCWYYLDVTRILVIVALDDGSSLWLWWRRWIALLWFRSQRLMRISLWKTVYMHFFWRFISQVSSSCVSISLWSRN